MTTVSTSPESAVLSGRDLTARVAEVALGIKRVHVGQCADGVFGAPPDLIASGDLPADHGRVQIPDYAENFTAALAVPKALGVRFPDFVVALEELLQHEETGLSGTTSLSPSHFTVQSVSWSGSNV